MTTKKKTATRASGFTLMELMVVVAIIGILAGLVSTAVYNVMRQAAKSRTDNQIAQISAAIQQYRSDFGSWPVPPGLTPEKTSSGTSRRPYWKLKFCSKGKGKAQGDNSDVVQYLLHMNASGSGRPKHDLLELRGFVAVDSKTTPIPGKSNDKSNVYAAEDLQDALELSDPNSDNTQHKAAPILVWRADMFFCDVCERYSDTQFCKNTGCEYYKSHKAFRKLPSSAKKEVAKPFYIEFDYTNDRVLVQRNPE